MFRRPPKFIRKSRFKTLKKKLKSNFFVGHFVFFYIFSKATYIGLYRPTVGVRILEFESQNLDVNNRNIRADVELWVREHVKKLAFLTDPSAKALTPLAVISGGHGDKKIHFIKIVIRVHIWSIASRIVKSVYYSAKIRKYSGQVLGKYYNYMYNYHYS